MEIIGCRDMEERAELFNDGYQEAMQHQTGGEEHRAWLIQVVQQIIADWVDDTAYQTVLAGLPESPLEAVNELRFLGLAEPWLPAGKAADAVLSEINFDES